MKAWCSLILLFHLSDSSYVFAQNWETYYYKFTGEIGGEKISGELVNRFGSLSGAYLFDKNLAARSASDPRDDSLVVVFEGTQSGSRITLRETRRGQKVHENPGSFVGMLQDTFVIGNWRSAMATARVLNFSFKFETNTDLGYRPPFNPASFVAFESKDLWSCGFFTNKKVQRELSRAMKKDLPAYLEWLERPMARTEIIADTTGLLLAHVWDDRDTLLQLTTIYLDPKKDRIYVTWSGNSLDHGKSISAYGDPLPAGFLEQEVERLKKWRGGPWRMWMVGGRIRYEENRESK